MAATKDQTPGTADGRSGDMAPEVARKPRAFVFGNVAVDEVFQVRNLPTPGESVLGHARHLGLGGKGTNQAVALARTGVPTSFVAAVGRDWHGDAIRKALSQEPLELHLIERANLPSDRSIIFAQEDGDNVIVTTNDCATSLTMAECRAVLVKAHPGDAVLLQGNLEHEVTAALARECRRQGARLMLNPSPFDASLGDLLPLTDALFVNETEAHGLTGLARHDAVVALRRAGARQVVLTLGAEGSLLGSGETVVHIPACPTDVVDVTGAGDCFEGVAVGSALLRGADLDVSAIRHASRAAAYTIGGLGAVQAFPTPRQISAMRTDTRSTGR